MRLVSAAVVSALVSALALAPTAHADTAYQPWTLRTAAGNYGWDGLAYGNGLFVAVSSSDARGSGIMTSPDGITWTARTPPAGNYDYRDVVWTGTQFVAVGSSVNSLSPGRAMTSPDGITWTARTMSANGKNFYGSAYGAGLIVAVGGNGGAIETSADGITWTPRTSGTTSNLRSVTYGGGQFVAVGSPAAGQQQVLTSPDGITWTPRTAAEDSYWYDVAYANGLYVAVAYIGDHRVMTSPDGITWTARDAASPAKWRSVVYGGGSWTAVAGDGADGSGADLGGGAVMSSPDGITWFAGTPASAQSWREVDYANGLFVVVGDAGGVMTAPPSIFSGTPGLVVRQSLPLGSDGSCAGIDDSAVGYGTGLTGGWSKSWQPWPNAGRGGFACVRALVNIAGRWGLDSTAA